MVNTVINEDTGLYNIMNCLRKLIITDDIQTVASLLDRFLLKEISQFTFFKEMSEYLTTIPFKSKKKIDITKIPLNVISGEKKFNTTKMDDKLRITTTTENTFEIGGQINNTGALGIILKTKINGHDKYVTKLVKIKEEKNQREALIENIIHVLLQCNRDNIQDWCDTKLGDTTFVWPFPDLKYILLGKFGTGPKLIMAGMDKIDCGFEDLQGDPKYPYHAYDILVQLCVMLYCLQESIGFIHRDLHDGNVMLKKREKLTDVTYRLKGETIVIKDSLYEVIIIDLGQSCLDMRNCGASCGNYSVLEGEPFSSELGFQVKCDNKAQDLRFFCARFVHFLARIYASYEETDFELLKKFIKFKKCLNSAAFEGISEACKKNSTRFHYPLDLTNPNNVYSAIHKDLVKYVPVFEPEHFFKSIKKWEKHLVQK